MKSRGLVERSLSFAKSLGGDKRNRRQMRIALLVGIAVFMLWSSPTTAQPGLPTMSTIAPPTNFNLFLTNDNANGAVFGGIARGVGGFGVAALASDPSSQNFGVAGATNSSIGTGVFGVALATTCPNIPPPVSVGSACVGVVGQSQATSGNAAGVFGTSQSSSGAGVAGQTTGIGASSSTAVAGVVGVATAASGFNSGVFGQTNSPNGAAIFGQANFNGGLAGSFNGGPVSINCPTPSPTSSCLTVNSVGVTVPDLAEDMPVARPVSPGDVVVLTRGQSYGVAPATQAYDTLVAGIVSTAPRVRFGIGKVKAAPVAMVGVVKAKATAVNGAIEFGDLLTTSRTPGHLMRCPTALRCIGAIVGKALEPLAKGENQILVMLWRQ